MSHNNDFLMEILDGEIPEAYRRKVEMEVSADPELSARLERFRSISRSMKAADQAQADEYQAAGIRLKSRLERSLDAAGQTRRPRAALRNLMDMTPRGFSEDPRSGGSLRRGTAGGDADP
jgi:anti-sigma factor RsiW